MERCVSIFVCKPGIEAAYSPQPFFPKLARAVRLNASCRRGRLWNATLLRTVRILLTILAVYDGFAYGKESRLQPTIRITFNNAM